MMAACYAAFRIVQRRRERREEEIKRKILRDRQNPFVCDVDVFTNKYGFDQKAVFKIHELILPVIKKNHGNPSVLKVLVSLHILRSGWFQSKLGNQEKYHMTQPTMSRGFKAFLDAIIEISSSVIQFPSISEFLSGEHQLYGHSEISNVMGVIKCFPVYLKRPNLPDRKRHQKRDKYCILVQIVCDSNLVILDANVQWPGDRPNSELWMNCDLRATLKEQDASNLCYLLGDESFPLEPWLLVPYEDIYKAEEIAFNDHINRALDVGIQCFGMLQTRFKAICHKGKPLNYKPPKASKIVMACLILHNIALQLNQELKEPLDYDEAFGSCAPYSDINSSMEEHILKNKGMSIRDEVAQVLLNS